MVTQPLVRFTAGYRSGMWSVGGTILIEDGFLKFQPARFQIRGNPISIPIDSIVSVELSTDPKKWSRAGRVFRWSWLVYLGNKIAKGGWFKISTRDGQEYYFGTTHAAERVELLQAALGSRIGDQSASPASPVSSQ